MKKYQLPSLSSSALLLECQAWVFGQEYDRTLTGHDQDAAGDGTLFHDLIDKWIQTGMKDDVVWQDCSLQIANWLNMAKDWLLVHSQAGWMIQSEVAFEVCIATGYATVIELPGPRQYPYRKGYAYGTADLILTKDDKVIVADWKTGGTDGAEAQLKSLGCAWVAFNNWDGEIELQTWKVTDEGVWSISYEYDPHHWQKMAKAYAGVGTTSPVPGIHCTQLYCPHLAHCKAYDPAVLTVAKAEGKKAVELTEHPTSDAAAGDVMSLVTALKRRAKYFENAMKAYAAKGGRVISGDYEFSQKRDGFRWRKMK